jgi:hypothetical protein
MKNSEQAANPYVASKSFADDAGRITWENFDANIRASQVIVVALTMGLVMFAIVAVTQRDNILGTHLLDGNSSFDQHWHTSGTRSHALPPVSL